MNQPVTILIAALMAVMAGVTASVFLEPGGEDRTPLAGTLFDSPRPIADFTLVDHTGQTFDHESLRGRWSLVFFGFTQCEGVCPLTLGKLNQAVEKIEQPPTVIFVSVDTERDSKDVLARYVRSFNDDFIGLTGDPAEIDKLSRSLLAPYSVRGEGANVTVDHSSTVFLIDPDGQFTGLFSAPLDAQALAEDIRKII